MLPYPLTPHPISLDRLSSLSLEELAGLHRRALEASRTSAGIQDVVEKMHEAPIIPEHSWPRPWRCLGRNAPPAVFRWISSNQMSSGVADLALPLTVLGDGRSRREEQQSASVVAYYMLVVSSVQDHQVFRFQRSSCGVFLEGSMRRRRWRNIERAVRALDQL